MSNILMINSQDYDDDDLIAGNVIVDNEGKTQEIIINVQEAERGPRGVGIPEGGTPGQILVKSSENDFSVAWTNLDIPTKTSELINDSGFITMSQVPVTSVNGMTGDVVIPTGQGVAQIYRGSDQPTDENILIWIDTSAPTHPNAMLTSEGDWFITSEGEDFVVAESTQLYTSDDARFMTNDGKGFALVEQTPLYTSDDKEFYEATNKQFITKGEI